MNTRADKDKNKKTRCPKNNNEGADRNGDLIKISAEVTAHIVGCAPTTVNAIRSGERSSKTPTGQRVILADTLLKEGVSALVDEVKKVVKL